MKTKIKRLWLLAIMMCVASVASAYDAEIDGIYYNFSGTNATVTYFGASFDKFSNEYTGSVTIPESVTYNGSTFSVTSIGESAFRGCTGLTSITIPNSVTSIGSYAFSGTAWYDNHPNGLVYAGKVAYKYKGTMPEGREIVLEEGTLGIAGSAFDGCYGLTSVTIPNSVTSIGDAAFENCWGLTSVTIPNSVTSIGEHAFWDCKGLTSVTIGNSVTSIGKFAFFGCTGLTSVEIPNSVTSIGEHAFWDCKGLTSVEIPNSVTSIGSYAFRGCSGLTSVAFNAKNCTTCGSSDYPAFPSTIKTLTIGKEVKKIPSYAFYGCTHLTSVTIPNSVTSIGGSAFYGCI